MTQQFYNKMSVLSKRSALNSGFKIHFSTNRNCEKKIIEGSTLDHPHLIKLIGCSISVSVSAVNVFSSRNAVDQFFHISGS